jgi:bifunctional pyridoxal-dependent enzyme with beta-cystathionase and maltose regulon repressor activities
LKKPASNDYIEVTAKELAKHLTVISADIFKNLKRKEMENVAWTGENKEIQSPTIVKMTRHFNSVALWISQQILNESKIKTRYQLIGFFISVGYVFDF